MEFIGKWMDLDRLSKGGKQTETRSTFSIMGGS